MKTQRVFVYGTLLWGEVNHARLADARWLGSCRTPRRFTLYHLGAYPGLVAHGSTAVMGEVYEISTALLRDLDRLEEYPRLYRRELIPTPFGRAWVYLYRGPVRDYPVITEGDWRRSLERRGPLRSRAVRRRRDAKNPTHAARVRGDHHV